MRKILIPVLVLTAFLLIAFESPKIQAVGWPGAPTAAQCDNRNVASSEKNLFPFNFVCPRNNNNHDAMILMSRPQPGFNDSTRILEGSTYIEFDVGFWPNGNALKSSSGQIANEVLLWTTVDVNNSVFNGFSNYTSGGNPARGCPGSWDGILNNGTTAITRTVYNFQDDAGIANNPSRPNASPAAWINGPPGGEGYENCGTQGRMIYWTMGPNFSNNSVTRTFRLNIDTVGRKGQQIKVRTNLSVSYGGNLWSSINAGNDNGLRNQSANDGNTASRIAKQSDEITFTIDNAEPQGNIVQLSCSNFTVRGEDPDHPGRPVDFRMRHLNSSGVGYTTVPNAAPYPTTTIGDNTVRSGSFVTGTTYDLQIYDIDSQQWVIPSGGSTLMTKPCDPPVPQCEFLFAADDGGYGQNNWPTNTYVFMYDSPDGVTRGNTLIESGATLSQPNGLTPGGGHLGRGQSYTWRNIEPHNTHVIIRIEHRYRGASGRWINYRVEDFTKRCYSATCSITSVIGDGRNGVVRAGRPYTINVNVTNTGPMDLPNTLNGHALSASDNGPHDLPPMDNGQMVPISYSATAPINGPGYPAGAPYVLNIGGPTPVYYGVGRGAFTLGGACGGSISVYQEFALSLNPYMRLLPDQEDPSQASYHAFINNSSPNAVSVPTVTTVTGPSGNLIAPINTSGPFMPGVNFYTVGNPSSDSTSNISGPIAAGDEYCTRIRANSLNGMVGPGGSGDVILTDAGPTTAPSCDKVTNKPYFKVLGSGVSAGGNFQSTGVCSGGGVIGGYYRDDSTDPYFDYGQGAGTDLYALATGEIKGFASAQSNAFKSPVELTFANSGLGASDVQNRQSDPNLGGKFAVDNCLTDVSEPSDLTFTQTFNGNTRIPGRTIGLGQNRSIFVNGDAYIDNSITYVDNGNWDYEKVPSFVLKATGNIYIDSSVGTLDGTYIAEATGPSTKGQIYTCAKLTPPNTFELVPKADRLSQCNRQLTIHGSFVARKVNLMRTYGSIRDEKPSYGVPGQPIGGRAGVTRPLVWSHSGKPAGVNECVLINEASEPAEGVAPTHHGWNDNWLCLDPADEARVDLDWTHGGSDPYPGPATPNCDNFIEATAELDPYTWSDNVLCTNAASVRLTVAAYGNPAGPNEFCTQMYEPWDTDGTGFWQQNGFKKAYVCISTYEPSGGRSPDTLPAPRNTLVCSNSGGGSTYVPRGGRLNTCAAEVFEFSPEFYLGQPATGDNEDEPIRFDALTSLPPVL